MSINNGSHVFNFRSLCARNLKPSDRRILAKIEALGQHNNKVATMRQDMSLGLPRLRSLAPKIKAEKQAPIPDITEQPDGSFTVLTKEEALKQTCCGQKPWAAGYWVTYGAHDQEWVDEVECPQCKRTIWRAS
jgi:hypothetical protein